MNCKKALSWLSAYQDGELSSQRSMALQNHLKNCAACHDELAVMQKLLVCLGSHTSLPPSPGFSSSIMAGLQARPENKFRLLPSLAYTLALLMIFISGFLLEISTNGQTPTIPQSTATFSAILSESRDFGLQGVQESTMKLFAGDDYEKQ